MKHRNPALLYFSFDKRRRELFWNSIHNKELNYQDIAIFHCLNKGISYNNIADLILFLNMYKGDFQSLHIIIDIISFNTDSRKKQIDSLRDAIVSFPEVQFLFDQHIDSDLILSDLLFYDEKIIKSEYADFPTLRWEDVKKRIYSSFLIICWEKPLNGESLKPFFYRIICGRDNTFDTTNLRYAIKYWKYVKLRVDKNRNFSWTQDSRSKSLALCVEEETNQNMFVSYSLYKNGYRVLPVTSATELKTINKDIVSLKMNSADSVKNVIIIRDYDLQFEDEGKTVDLVRGYKHCTQKDINDYYISINDPDKHIDYYPIGWTSLLKSDPIDETDNYFWNNLIQYKTYFITKGPHFSVIVPPSGDLQTIISEDRSELLITGFQKPVSGLYLPFHRIYAIGKRYAETRQMGEFVIERNKHDHSTPLDIYDMINSMLKRAEQYYNERRFRLAALVSCEALEFLNGFHHRLMIKAYYILAISENAIAMDVVGSNELYLAKDAQFRVDKIIEDVDRFYYGYEKKSKWNVLNHIFSTCRQFCKEHEHFESEAVFISAIAHLNEGYEFSDILYELRTIGQKILKESGSICRTIKNWYTQKRI